MIQSVNKGQDAVSMLHGMVKAEAEKAGASFMESMAQAVARASEGSSAQGRAAEGLDLRAKEDVNADFGRMEEASRETDVKAAEKAKDKEAGEVKENPETDRTQEADKTQNKEEAATEERAETEGTEELTAEAQAALAAQMALQDGAAETITVDAAAADAQGVQQNVAPVEEGLAMQVQTADTMSVQAAETGAEAGTAAANAQADANQVDFVNQVMREIDQNVAGNEAERSEPVLEGAQQAAMTAEGEVLAEQDAAEAGVHKHIDTETESAMPETAQGAQGAAQGTAQGTVGQIAQQPDAVVTVPADAAAAQQVIQNSLLEQVQSAVSEGKSELFIKFRPDVLGGLQIQLAMTEEGLRAQIRTTDAAIRGMLGAEMGQLTEALRARGVEVVEMDVYYEQSMANNTYLDQRSGAWQGTREEGAATQQPYRGGGEGGAEEAAYEAAAYERMMLDGGDGYDGGVDFSA